MRARRPGRRSGEHRADGIGPTRHGNDVAADAASHDGSDRARAGGIDDVDGTNDHGTDAHHHGRR